MVNAGRILIMPRGEWDALTSYNMLDLVTENGVAYLAKQANVGQDPALDTTMTYWQTFGSAVVPDNETIIYDGDGDLAVNLDGTTLKYDAVNSYIKVAIDGVTLKYDSVNGYIYADVSTSLAGLDDVQLTSIQNGQIIAYNSTSQKFVNIDLPVGGGSKIKVTTAEATLYGQTVTLSDGVTTLSGTFSNSGEYTFEGVELTGNLTISSSDGNDRATRTLYVQYYSSYAVSLAFFEATVTVTFPYTEGASCTLSDGVTTLSATTSPMAFSVPNTGTWTASVTLDGVSKTDTVTITTDGQTEALTIEYGTINVTYDNDFRGVSINCVKSGVTITKTAPASGNTMVFYPPTTGNWAISGNVGGTIYGTNANVTSLSTPVPVTLETIPNGSTATPTDDIQKWLACAGIKDKAYTTLTQVLGDSETYNALLGDSNACAYMKRSTTWSTDICASQYAMNLLGQYDTACDALLSDATWASAIAQSAYFESVVTPLVPKMTSNTAPSGEVFGSNIASATPKYTAFDRDTSTVINNDSGIQIELGYKFDSATKVYFASVTNRTNASPYAIKDFTIKGSADGTTYTDLASGTATNTSGATTTVVLSENTNYSYFKMANTTAYDSSYVRVAEVQFYGRTTSSEMVHGTNGESAYILDGGSPVTITDPSTLDAGTYTFYSTVAKDPANLSNDYSKTIRICPNTKEIVVRPDNSLYWWGYNGGIQNMSSSDGWSIGDGWLTPTWNNTNITLNSASSKNGGIASIYQITTKTIAYIGKFTSTSDSDRVGVRLLTSKSSTDYNTNCAIHCTVPDSVVEYDSATVVNDATGWLTAMTGWGSAAKMELYALLYE